MTQRLKSLSQAGVSVWLDDLSRERLETGNLAELITQKSVVGVTTNPTIFAGAMGKGDRYNDSIASLAADGHGVDEVIRALTTDDVRSACDVLGDVYRSDNFDGRVSIEVEPGLAMDTDATIAQARELWQTVDRPNVMIKIPATEPGLPAITAATAEGISVNVTRPFQVAGDGGGEMAPGAAAQEVRSSHDVLGREPPQVLHEAGFVHAVGHVYLRVTQGRGEVSEERVDRRHTDLAQRAFDVLPRVRDVAHLCLLGGALLVRVGV